MPAPVSQPGVSGNNVNLAAAPGGDLNFDDLFPPEGVEVPVGNPAQPQAAAPGTVTPAAPQVPQPEEFIKAPSGTVYKTREEAERGISEKDALIERLRQDVIAIKGVDPVTGKPVVQQTPQAGPVNYAQDGKRYFADLVDRIQKNDESGYAEVQRKFVYDSMAPYAPLLAEVSRQQAVRKVAAEVQEFPSFIDSADYRKTLDSVPLLKSAISQAESSPDQAGNLSDLYKLAYLTAQGVRATSAPVTPVTPAPVPSPTPARPSMAASTLAPPTPAVAPNLRTSEGRKALIADLEARGILDRPI